MTRVTKKKKAAAKKRTTRAERRALRTEEILATALDLIKEGGLAAVTTTELARRNGAALGALYRFFPSKGAVIAALQVQAMDELLVELTATRDAARGLKLPETAKAWAPFLALADTWFLEAQKNPARFRLLDEMLSAPDPVLALDDARRLEGATVQLLELLGSCVADVNADPVVAKRFPFALWGALHGVSHFQKRDRVAADDHKAARIAASLVLLLLKGLGASDDDLDAAWKAVKPKALAR